MMTVETKPLVQARSHIAMIWGLLGGLALIFWIEGINLAPKPEDPMAELALQAPLPLATPRAPSETELRAATIAWTYFRNNIDAGTGLVASVDGYPSTTLWETGSLLTAIVSAERLGLIQPEEAKARLTRVVDSLSRLRLTMAGLPNKAYDIRSLDMVNYQNKKTETGIGWSALDMGRLLSGLAAARRAHPELAGPIQDLLARWDMARLAKGGELNGGNIKNGVLSEHQEGRVGYEQYAAKAMMAFTLDATSAVEIAGHVTLRDAGGVAVPGDTRLNKNAVPAMTTSEPYLLDGLEFGFDARSHLFGSQVYRAQENRFAQTGVLTAVTEGHINAKPYFAYATVWGGGQAFAVLTMDGQRVDSKRVISTKAAFGWDALFDTEYTDRLVEAVGRLNDPARGWMEGMYEVDGSPNSSITANTNAMILAAIAFRQGGPLTAGAR